MMISPLIRTLEAVPRMSGIEGGGEGCSDWTVAMCEARTKLSVAT